MPTDKRATKGQYCHNNVPFYSIVCFRTSRHLRRFPFDQKFRFEISKISRGKWNSKSGNFPDGYTSLGGPSHSIQFWTEIYDREVLQTEILSNGTVTSDQNGPTAEGGPSFPKISRLVRTVPFSFGPEFPGNFG